MWEDTLRLHSILLLLKPSHLVLTSVDDSRLNQLLLLWLLNGDDLTPLALLLVEFLLQGKLCFLIYLSVYICMHVSVGSWVLILFGEL